MDTGRDAKGRFIAGHKHSAGTGRPPRSVEERFFQGFSEATSLQDWIEATRALMARAKKGDAQAYKLLASYAVGNPLQRVQTEVVETVEVSEEYRRMAERVFGVDDDDG